MATPEGLTQEGLASPGAEVVTRAIESALATLAMADGPAKRSEYLEYWAPSTFRGSGLPSKADFDASLALPLGARCMLERNARGVADPDAPATALTRI